MATSFSVFVALSGVKTASKLDIRWNWLSVMKASFVIGATTRVAVVDLVMSPAVPVMVSTNVPGGVLGEVVRKSVEVPVGVTLPGLKLAVAPAGRPEMVHP